MTAGKKRLFARKRIRALLALVVVLSSLLISGVRLYAFHGESMAPAVRAGERFVGLVGLWGMGAPERFEMVIFHVPPNSKWAERGVPWMKRLVGLPGETVRLSGGRLFINGEKVEAPFLRQASAAADFQVTLGEDEYCVLGDNLDRSFEDSRSMGPIKKSRIKGRVFWVL